MRNKDNSLTGISTSGGPTYSFDASTSGDIDGLGRLKLADETISYPGQSNRSHTSEYTYNRQSGLTRADITGINSLTWTTFYTYNKDGNISLKRTYHGGPPKFINYEYDTTPGGDKFDSDIMTEADGNELDWDDNGRLAETPAFRFGYNWDGKLRDVNDSNGNRLVSYKYDAMGNRVCKNSAANGNQRYIVDVASAVPKVLLILDANNNDAIIKTFIHTDREVLMQYDGNSTAKRYYYLHDRLGSVRLIIDSNGYVVNSYTYDPYGRAFDSETQEIVSNPYRFAGYYWDEESKKYYCNARYYDPMLMRFTTCDSIEGSLSRPLSKHKYLYCETDPINGIDPLGLWKESIHRSFGRYGSGYAGSIFDYARLDFDKPALNTGHDDWTKMHFLSKHDAAQDILAAIISGDITGFEYGMHEYQDTYTHYDRKFYNGHPPWPWIDDMDWKDSSDVAAYRSCYQMTRFFENMFIKNNIDIWMEHSKLELPKSNPWLATIDSWASSSIADRFMKPIYKQQMMER